MKITDIFTKIVEFDRVKVFRIAFDAGSPKTQLVYVKITTDEGICGYGEAAPFAMVTGETINGVIETIKYLKSSLIGKDPTNIAEIHRTMDSKIFRNPSAKAAIDIACYDIMGKSRGMAVHKMLGATEDSLQTDITLGIDTVEESLREALQRKAEGFRILKIKLGCDPDKDVRLIREIRAAVGNEIELRVDANQSYDIETAMRVFTEIKKQGVVEAEQPLPYYDIHGMAELNKISPIDIMADESIHTAQDAEIACQHDACKIINIKLMKCGGIYPALKICEVAEKYGKPCIIGCMYESKLAISASAAVFLAKECIVGADLDSFFCFTNPEAGVSGGFTVDKDIITMSHGAGFGFDECEF